MNIKLIIPVLILISLFYVGCTESKQGDLSRQNESNQSAKPEVAISSPTPIANGLSQLTSIKGTGQLAPSTANQFTFAVFGDSQGDANSEEIAGKLFKAVHDYQPQPAFAFCLGDIVKGKDPTDPISKITEKYNAYLGLVKTAGIPVFNAPGNHEMDDRDDVPSQRMHDLYNQLIAPTNGSFDYSNSHFIALNTEDVPPPNTPPPGNGEEFSYIGDTQLQQLDADLAANTAKTHIFVMMHYPIKPKREKDTLNPESVKKLTAILAKYKNISYVLASHEHFYYNPQNPPNVTTIAPFKTGDATQYLISGGAGASLGSSPQNGGFYHFLIFEVNGDNISVKINKING